MASEEDKSGAPAAPEYGLLHFRGADARKFLQGQLSNDLNALKPYELMLAAAHSPQGRVLALLRLAALANDHVIALLPAELVETTSAGLRRYVLRAKVAISSEVADDALAEVAVQVPAFVPFLEGQARARAIAAGIAQVYRATSGEFVAQMLNLDCIGAISFTKGCYTGQEIIARSHYRGRTKRRLQRFESVDAVALEVGESVRLGDGRSARIVDAVARADGRSEFLAVAPLDVSIEREPAGNQSGVQTREVMATQLPLPYPLPE